MRAFAVIVAIALATGDVHAESVPLVVIVAKGAKVTNLTKAELKRCFSGEAVMIGEQRLIPFNLAPASVERAAFERTILGMSPEQAGRYWVDRKIRGQGQPPRQLTASSVVKIVAKFPGAIGYVTKAQVTSDVRVISIDGAAPGTTGYPTFK